MGSAVASDGTLAMQCQSCHGSMSDVAAPTRTGWLQEPACQSCHTGTAVRNAGQIRFASVFDATGHVRQAADPIFATTPDAPAPGLSLYRFSSGHGGLACETCHGSTHAEFPSSHRNDNIQSIARQGHEGMLVECTTCHVTQPVTVTGGPHGMHPVGQSWVGAHPDAVEQSGAAACRACHGADYRGTELSRAQADRTIGAFGTKNFWRGFEIGCYTCHAGPGSGDANPNRAPVAQSTAVSTPAGTPKAVPLAASDADHDALELRIVTQPPHGTVALAGTAATYFPESGFTGVDSFTFAASDGQTDSNLATVTLFVGVTGTTSTTTSTTIPGSTTTSTIPGSASLALTFARLRAAAEFPSGSIALKGTFAVGGGPAFDATGGVAVGVRDGATLDVAVTFSSAECQTKSSGKVSCKSGDRRSTAAFTPARPASVRFSIKLKKRAIQGPFAPPVGATLTEVGPGTTRSGAIGSCMGGERTLTCK